MKRFEQQPVQNIPEKPGRIHVRREQSNFEQTSRYHWAGLAQNPGAIERDIEEKARSILENQGRISLRLLNENEPGLAFAVKKYYPGGLRKLKETVEAGNNQIEAPLNVIFNEAGLPISKSGNIWWSILAKDQEKVTRVIETEARKMLTSGIKLTQSGITKAGQSGFIAAIYHYYPGGLQALKRKFGQELSQHEHGYWTPEKIKDESLRVLATHGNLTQGLLTSLKRNDLSIAIARKYPGGLTQLKRDLGLVESTKEDGYWKNIDTIRSEAKIFFQETGKLDTESLYSAGKSSLASAIVKRYPGSFYRLRKDLGLKGGRKPTGFWSSQEGLDLMRVEAQNLLKQEGHITVELFNERRKSMIGYAIRHYYPGGIKQLKEELGHINTTNEANIQIEALLKD